MTSRRALLLTLIGVTLGATLLFAIPRRIDEREAERIATRLLDQYARSQSEGRSSFLPLERALWADGWEFRWRYRACADIASLRVWIRHDGRETRYTELPDCLPQRPLLPSEI
jgi:hypothetical protein